MDAAVGERRIAAVDVAFKRLLARVGALVGCQSTGFGERLLAAVEVALERLLPRVGALVDY